MNTNTINVKNPNDEKINVKIILAALWAAHFLLWTFGDAMSLMQGLSRPAADNLLLCVSAPTAIAQALMVFLSLAGKAKSMRYINLGAAVIFAAFNIGFIADARHSWQYLLGAAYLLFNALVIWHAWKWRTRGNAPAIKQ